MSTTDGILTAERRSLRAILVAARFVCIVGASLLLHGTSEPPRAQTANPQTSPTPTARNASGQTTARARLSDLLAPFVVGELPTNPTGIVVGPSVKVLKLHTVVRYECKSVPEYCDYHVPVGGQLSEFSGTKSPYQDAIDAVLAEFAAGGRFKLEPDEAQADVIVWINLAERRQTSKGFTFDDLIHLRGAQLSGAGESATFSLPWSTFQLGYKNDGSRANITGALVWIGLPKRAFWQSEVAQNALDYPDLATRLRLGRDRKQILGAYRSPHTSELPSLEVSLAEQRGAWSAGKSSETLLSIAQAALQNPKGWLHTVSCPECAAKCGEIAHSRAISRKLNRSLAMIELATMGGAKLQTGAITLDDVEQSALAGHEGRTDQLLDELLLASSARTSRLRSATTVAEGHQIGRSELIAEVGMQTERADFIANLDAAISEFSPGGEGCLSLTRLVSTLSD